MKPKTRATHLVLLQRLPKGLLWLNTRLENNTLVVLGAGFEPLGELSAEEGAPVSVPTQLRNALLAIHAHLKLGWMARYEVIAIAPSDRLTTRFLDTPPIETDTLSDLVAFEVSEALQVSIDDIAWDMLISSEHGDEPKKKLLWIAARKEYIHNLMSEWPEDRLSPTQLTPDFWGYYEYLLGTDATCLHAPSLLVSREGERATITIADRGSVYLTRSVPLKRAGRSLDELEGSGAEEYALSMEIERTLYYAADRSTPSRPSSMIVCGFEDWKLDRLRMVADGNGLHFAQLKKDDLLSAFASYPASVLPEHLSMLSIAYCQLRRNIIGPNLLDTVEESLDWRSFIPDAALPSKKFISIGGALLALFLVLAIGKSFWFNQAIETRLSRGQDLIKLSNRLQREEIALRQLARTNVDFAEMFLFLAKTLPDGIMVKNLSIDAKSSVALVFTGGNNQQAVDLLKKLNESSFFRDIQLDRSVVEKDGFTIYMNGKLQSVP